MTLSLAILALVTAQRLGELVIARRNTARLLAQGGIESGAAHYPFIVIFHALWLIGLWYFAWDAPVSWTWLGVFVLVQMMRWWVIGSLGGRWTTRIITMPGEALVAAGPYRYVRHPNYLVVAAEIFALPMVFGLVWYAVAASVLNGLLMLIRIPAENAALRPSRPTHSAGGPS